MIQINGIKVALTEDKDTIIKKNIKELIGQSCEYTIVKESIDARKDIVFVYTVNVDTDKKNIRSTKKINFKYLERYQELPIEKGSIPLKNRPVVIGFGPAGIFAALELAKHGYKPIVFERGKDVYSRKQDVDNFWENGILHPESNVQFGEGGAGTFSDGKLTTRIKDKRVGKLLESLVRFGAPEDIIYTHKPHVGTDILIDVVKNIREEIVRLGGEIHFESKLSDIEVEDGRIKAIKINDKWLDAEAVILSIGHSARDTYRMLFEREVTLVPKPFAVGFRIEHPQIVIDKAQFKEHYNHPKLKAAEYHLTYTTKSQRACYTFCMCPGGRVIASASSPNQVVVNGMSYHSRGLDNANSAVLCSITPEDMGKDILSGINFQEQIEHKAFIMGGSNYSAPIQLVGDFLNRTSSKELGGVAASYKPSCTFARLDTLYPEYIYESISEAILDFGKKLKGFDMTDAVLTGVETRTSSPLRIKRDDRLEADNLIGLYPCGEGAGYAGGIVSAAVDGIKAATSIMYKFCI